jgi:DNA-binding LytR/AlgR family response regulator
MRQNLIVCDDESIALKMNCSYIEELSKKYRLDANITGFSGSDKVLEYSENNDIDMAFLDIDLKGINGISLASRLLKKNPRIITIFITGHREFAYEAFNVEAFGYLTKPVDSDRLERVFKKALLQMNDMNNRLQRIPLIITEDNVKKKISQQSIIYIERVGAQSIILTRNGKHSVYETITSLAGRLEGNFVQINQGMIVNLEEVQSIQGNQVIMKSEEIFIIGRTYSKEAKRKFLEYPRI